jgi:probable HAF family extracellular repeat protein
MKLRARFAIVGVLLAFVCTALAQTAASAAQKYTVTDLGALPGFTSGYADDNNNSGLVTGCSDNSVYPTVPCTTSIPADAFLWSSTSGMQDLGHLSGDDMTVGYVVNDSSEVVGFSGSAEMGGGHGFYWTQSGGMVDLGTLTGSSGYSIGEAITSKGVIVGASTVSNGDVHVVLWTKSGGIYHIHDEGHLPKAPYTYPYDINESQQVVGIAYFNEKGTKYHAFQWSKAAGWKDLGTLTGGTNSYAVWINTSGVIVGDSTSTKYPKGVVVYWDSSGKHSIGTLPGGTYSAPGFISDAGEILGDSTVTGGADHAFIWTKSKGMQDLNNVISKNSGWVLHHASSIDNSGQIVGYGTINGVNHPFLLTPKQ